MKKISLIIPHYKEDSKTIWNLLNSIDIQHGISFNDIEVIIVDDCGGVDISEAIIKLKHYVPTVIKNEENIGLGRTRNVGFDNSIGEYVMFCDADDMFFSPISLKMYMDYINTDSADIVTSLWYEELNNPNFRNNLVLHTENNTWVHAKLFRRQYLVDKNIRHHELFRVHEDAYFVGLAWDLANKIHRIPDITYLWKWNDNSLVRTDNSSFDYKTFGIFVEAFSEAFKQIEKFHPEKCTYKAVHFFCSGYFILHRSSFLSEDGMFHLSEVYDHFRKAYQTFGSYYDNAPKAMIADTLLNAGKDHKGPTLLPFESFMNRIM